MKKAAALSKKKRCPWSGTDPLFVAYHDQEWGVPVHDDRVLFEFLVLEGAQAGLSWITILRKRDAYRRAFDRFDQRKVARYDKRKVEALLADAGIVLGGSRIVTSVQSALGYQRVEQLANMSYDVTGLAARLEDERDQTLEYIGEGPAGRPGTLSHNTAGGAPENLQLVTQDQSLTRPWISKVQADAAAIGDGYPEPGPGRTRRTLPTC